VVYESGGNIGIGTTSPGAKLSIEDSNPIIALNNTSTGNAGIKISRSGTSKWTLAHGGSYFFFYDYSGGSARMVIEDGSGEVGIGTTSPSYKLHVVGDIAYTGDIYDLSDVRLKENIKPLDNALERVASINSIYFNNKGASPDEREVRSGIGKDIA